MSDAALSAASARVLQFLRTCLGSFDCNFELLWLVRSRADPLCVLLCVAVSFFEGVQGVKAKSGAQESEHDALRCTAAPRAVQKLDPLVRNAMQTFAADGGAWLLYSLLTPPLPTRTLMTLTDPAVKCSPSRNRRALAHTALQAPLHVSAHGARFVSVRIVDGSG
jgi:hypothetical protein